VTINTKKQSFIVIFYSLTSFLWTRTEWKKEDCCKVSILCCKLCYSCLFNLLGSKQMLWTKHFFLTFKRTFHFSLSFNYFEMKMIIYILCKLTQNDYHAEHDALKIVLHVFTIHSFSSVVANSLFLNFFDCVYVMCSWKGKTYHSCLMQETKCSRMLSVQWKMRKMLKFVWRLFGLKSEFLVWRQHSKGEDLFIVEPD